MRTEINTFKDLVLFINSNNLFFKKVILVSIFSAVLYSFFATVYFESKITLYPAGELSDSSEIFSDFSDLIESLGISDLSPENNFYIPDIIESENLRKKIVNHQWQTERFINEVDLIDFWELKNKSLLSKFILSFKNFFNSFNINNDLLYEIEAVNKLEDLIFVDEQNSGLIEVIVLMEEPKLAADIVNFISNYVIDYVGNEQRKFASQTRQYLEERMFLAKNELYESENILTDFRKQYPLNLDTPELQLERLRLIRSVNVNQEVFVTIRKQYELSKIEESKARLFINILDEGKVNIYKEYPKRFIVIISFTLLGFIIGLLYLLLNKKIKEIF